MRLKKYLFIIITLGLCFWSNRTLADDTINTPHLSDMDIDSLGIHPYKKRPTSVTEFARWSLTFEAGTSLIDGDFNQPNITIVPKTKIRPSGAISLTYDFTPEWGIIGVYSYGNYGVKQKGADDFLLYGHMHSLELLLSYDLTDAWFPRRKTNIFSLYLIGGLGLGFYNSELDLNDGTYTPRADGRYDEVGMISMGLLAEFNITREIGLGAKGLYHVYTNDVLDGKMQGTNNDCMEYVSVYLRWKLEGRKKNHVRNLTDESDFLNQLPEKTEPIKDTIVVSQKDTIIFKDSIISEPCKLEQRYYVYFDNDRYNLKDRALIEVQQFAELMVEDTTICAELTGYCDTPGSESHNATLSQNRANRVRKELMDVYGISENRIIATGKGRIMNVGSSYAPNRRVSVRFISQEECDSLHIEMQQDDNRNISTYENKYDQDDVIDVVTTKTTTTLIRLARKYYNNSNCWPYIYEANENLLKNPDIIPLGIKLTIPRLSAELIDASNNEAMAKAHTLAKKYLKK